ncbi:hypothetical protein GTP45_13675 [Pseudoduganella sp. FT55W]|uniref:DUF4398 domain-containing protein n=1 Tax=Duganella rivi TaxID=2666083 RepID=A0A7X4GSL9_9BURK|nr:hypothetical protein [Duganella rivi]MYM67877.1 hypothetical protein [Duganella rivi]
MKISSLFLLALLALGGCASTPQAALDQANHGAALSMGLSAELQRFSEQEQRVMAIRQAEIARNNAAVAAVSADQEYDLALLRASNRKAETDLYKTLLALSDARAAAAKAALIDAEKAAKEFDNLLAALPDRTKEIDGVTTALTALGRQLSAGERYHAAKDFVDPVRKTIKDSKEKIEEANKAAQPKID